MNIKRVIKKLNRYSVVMGYITKSIVSSLNTTIWFIVGILVLSAAVGEPVFTNGAPNTMIYFGLLMYELHARKHILRLNL